LSEPAHAYQHIDYAAVGGILTITLDRPDRLNAFTTRMGHELCDAFDKSDADDDIRAVVLTGRGRAFCAGMDLGGGSSTFDVGAKGGPGADEYRDAGGVVTLRMYASKKPIIAAVNGAAVGVGATMTLAADVRLAGEHARYGFVFSRRGLPAESCSSWFLPRLVGISQALEWCFAGEIIDATEALRGGLVKEVLPADDLLPAAYALAHRFADGTSAVSIAVIRALLVQMQAADHPMAAHLAESRALHALGSSPDVHEGVAAFLEQRTPDFPMRVSTDLPDLPELFGS
jgi:enoyl-CoA hydratase/carnithine racemase